MIAIFTIIIIILSAIFIVLTKPKLLYYVMIFFAGWYSLSLEIGLGISLYELIYIIFLLWLPIYLSLKNDAVRLPRSSKYLFVFVCYALVVTVVARLFAPESYIASFTRGEGRWIFQIALLFIDITPVFLPLLLFKRMEDVNTAAKVFVASTCILCILGWFQIFALYRYGTHLFPIYREGVTGQLVQTGAFNMFGLTFYRMNSLGGEPKLLGMTIAVAIFVLIVARIADHRGFRLRIKGNLLLGFFLISLIMTFATSAIAILVIGLVLFVILSFFVKDLNLGPTFKAIATITVFAMTFFGIIVGSGTLSLDTVKDVMLARTFARSPIEDFDFAVLGFLSEHSKAGLFGVGMGDIHLYARYYLPDYARRYAYGGVFTAKSGYLRIVSELGVMGLILFLWAYLAPIRYNFRYQKYVNEGEFEGIIFSYNLFAVFILTAFLLRGYLVGFAYITLGLIYFINREVRRSFQLNLGK